MTDDLDPSGDLELWKRWEPELELLEDLLGPVGAVMKYARTRTVRTLETAADLSRSEPAAIARHAIENEAFGDLLRRAVEGTQRTRVEQKRNAFGRAIARGHLADDDAAVDLEIVMTRIIDRLEMPHIRALELIAARPDESAETVLVEGMGEEGRIVLGALAGESLLVVHPNFDEGADYKGLTAAGHAVRAYFLETIDSDP